MFIAQRTYRISEQISNFWALCRRCSLKEKRVKLLKEKGLKIRYPLTWREFFKGRWTPNQICSLIFLSFPLWFFHFSTFELHLMIFFVAFQGLFSKNCDFFSKNCEFCFSLFSSVSTKFLIFSSRAVKIR